MSVVETNRRQLEAIGDYVTRANVDWFAIFPDKMGELDEVAAANDRQPNLVVYRTRSSDDRDHHVIPFSELSSLLVDETLTHFDVNGTVRWNVTLKDHVVRVSHSNLSVDVGRFFSVPLAIELGTTNAEDSRAIDLGPPSRAVATTYRILRDTAASRQLKTDHEHRCQICGLAIDLVDGTHYAEAHHVRPLGRPHDGPDARENMIVLCPNHHVMCDYGAIRLTADMLRKIDGHAVSTESILYHNEHVFRGTTVA